MRHGDWPQPPVMEISHNHPSWRLATTTRHGDWQKPPVMRLATITCHGDWPQPYVMEIGHNHPSWRLASHPSWRLTTTTRQSGQSSTDFVKTAFSHQQPSKKTRLGSLQESVSSVQHRFSGSDFSICVVHVVITQSRCKKTVIWCCAHYSFFIDIYS